MVKARQFIRVSLLPVLLSLSVVIIGRMLLSPHQVKVDLWPGDVREFRPEGGAARDLVGLMVSITPFDEVNYLIADYSKIILFNREKNSISLISPQIAPPLEDKFKDDKRGNFVYNPTGLFFSPLKNLLYVANYTGNNILIGSIDVREKKFIIKDEISSGYTISPENVFVEDEGNYLVCANFDGNSVTAYDISHTQPKFMWSTYVENAHGACIVGNKVYATGLAARAVFELELQSGKVIKKSGKAGWNPGKNQYLWPTTIFPYSKNELVVSDARSGFITVLDIRSLKVKKYFGGNGPTFHYFNMPYCAIVHANKIIILSTFQKRIIVGERESLEMSETISCNRNEWRHLKKIAKAKIRKIGDGWKGSDWNIWRGGPVLPLFGEEYLLGFKIISPLIKERALPTFVVPDVGTLFNGSCYLYFLDKKESEDGFLLFSPQGTQAYFVVRDDVTYIFPVMMGMDCWEIENEIHNSLGIKNFEKVQDSNSGMIEKLKERRQKRGLITGEDVHQIIFPSYTRDLFEKRFKEVFSSESGKKFYDSYSLLCSLNKCPGDKAKDIAREYYSGIADESPVNIDEFIMVQVLTGFYDYGISSSSSQGQLN